MAKSNVVKMDEPKEKTPSGWAMFWQKELEAARKRLRNFNRQGNGVVQRYTNALGSYNDDTIQNRSFNSSLNLFWSNITTLQAMLYGNTPRIDVSREFHDPDDDVARVAALMYQRILQTDCEESGEDFPTALKAALQDRLLPGLGICRVSYEFESSKKTILNPDSLEPEETETIEYEEAPIDYIHWQDFSWGWARTWTEIPWIAYRSWLTKEEVSKRFGVAVANSVTYKNQSPGGEKDSQVPSDQKSNIQKAEIWEIWYKKDEKVYWYSEGAENILDAIEDPLKLDGFWPSPRPMMANLTTTLFEPKADFCFAQDLYNEIDLLQMRISNITTAVKVVGVYDRGAGDSVGRMLKEGTENSLIPVDNWAMFAEKGGLQGSIQWLPVKEVVDTLNVLIGIRDQTISLLNEITGMSDILRGANTDQYTSDGTNQLTAKFGSIRVQALQDEFARFASDLQAMKAQIISKHFRPDSITKQSNARFLEQADLLLVPQALELMKSEDVKWRVVIRPESLSMIDYAQLKSERTEYLTATATFLQSATSMAKEVPEALPLLLKMLQWGLAGFKGSESIEGTMDKAISMAEKAPPKPQEDPNAQKDQAAMALAQFNSQSELQKIQAKAQADIAISQAKHQQEMEKLAFESQQNINEIQADSQADTTKRLTDLQSDLQEIAAKLDADLQVERAQSGYAITETQATAEADQTLAAQENTYSMAQIEAQKEAKEDEIELQMGMPEDDTETD